MKLKNKLLIGIFGIFFISSISTAVAAEEGVTYYCQGMVCSTTPPAPTAVAAFAIVDAQTNEVKGVISGSVEYFGNNDKTVGKENPNCLSECKVILQATSDPVTGNVSGYKSSGSTEVTHNPAENIFTVKQDGVVVQEFIVPEVNKTSTSTTITSLSVSFSDTSTPTTNLPQQINQSQLNSATINASEITTSGLSVSVVSESLVIEQKVSKEEAITIINNSNNNIMKSKINRLIKLLGDWLV